MTAAVPGRCRFCGCTEGARCNLRSFGEDSHCVWLSGTNRTVCTNPRCLVRNRYMQKQAASAAVRKYRDSLERWLMR